MPEDLYALAPEDFTAARDAAVEQARAEGDRALAKELAGLRRPTVPAHLVNLLVRAEPDLVGQLLELGGQLAEAQRAGSGTGVRELGEQRRALVSAVTARALDLGGREATAAVRGEVEATLEAALADPAASDAVRSGRLVRALSFAGFGGADLDGAVAPAPTAETPPSPTTDAAAVRVAERSAQQAAGRLDDAVRVCEQAQQQEDDAVDRLSAASDRETGAEQALADARAARQQAGEIARSTRASAADAADGVREAQAAAEAARAALDRLRRGT